MHRKMHKKQASVYAYRAEMLNVGSLRNRLRGNGAAQAIRSLAVLPLENLSRDPGLD